MSGRERRNEHVSDKCQKYMEIIQEIQEKIKKIRVEYNITTPEYCNCKGGIYHDEYGCSGLINYVSNPHESVSHTEEWIALDKARRELASLIKRKEIFQAMIDRDS